MNLLLVAATKNEFDWLGNPEGLNYHQLISGVGLLNTAVKLSRYLCQNKIDLVMQVGIAGSYNPSIIVGSAVTVHSECLPELGVMEDGEFKSLKQLGLIEDSKIYQNGTLINPHVNLLESAKLPLVKGATVMEISTNEERITRFKENNKVDIESMEGAACHHVCLEFDIPFIQIRGISNIVGERDKRNWQFAQPMRRVRESIENICKSQLFR
jgi:futalosine hydrolase